MILFGCVTWVRANVGFAGYMFLGAFKYRIITNLCLINTISGWVFLRNSVSTNFSLSFLVLTLFTAWSTSWSAGWIPMFIIKEELGHLGNPKTRTTNDNYINQFCSSWDNLGTPHNLSVCVSFFPTAFDRSQIRRQKGGAFLPRTRRFQQFREVGPTGRSQVANWGSGPTSRDRDWCWLFCLYVFIVKDMCTVVMDMMLVLSYWHLIFKNMYSTIYICVYTYVCVYCNI